MLLNDEIAHRRYIRTHWNDLACFGWYGFLVQGQGVLWVDIEEIDSEDLMAACFVPASDGFAQESLFNDEIIDLMKQYHPRSEIVVVFADAEGRRRAYRRSAASSGLTPPQAYHEFHVELGLPPIQIQ